MNKYGPKAQAKIDEVMHEYGEGKLKSSSGNKVTDRNQAMAIAIGEARRAGYKVPKQPDE
jgi:hypothetical protein